MAQPLDRLRGSKAVRLLFSLALVAGLWPATSLAAPRPAYADDSAAPSVDVEGYVKTQADSGKVGEEKAGFLFWGGQELHGTGKYLTVKHTYAQNLEEGDTISSIMTDIDQMAEKFISVGRDYAQIYEVDGNAEYDVAFVAPSSFNGASSAAVDFVAALNGTDGRVVSGVEFDKESGLAYIPKSLLDSDECAERGLQVQTLEPTAIDDSSDTSFEVTIDNENSGVTAVAKSQTVTAQRFDSTIEFQVATADTAANLSLSDMEITINDGNVDFAPQGESGRQSAGYDPETGKVWISATPASVASVRVAIKGGGMFGAQKAYASVSAADMNTLPEFEFTNMDLSQVWIGDTFRYTGPTWDIDDYPNISWWRQNYLYLPNADGRGWPTNANGQWVASGSVSGNESIYEFEEEWSTASDEMHDAGMISGVHTSDWGASVDFSYSGDLFKDYGRGSTWGVDSLPGYCAHVALAGVSSSYTGADGSRWDIPIICRVLAKGDDWVVLGFAQSMIYNQAGFGAYKFKVQSKGDLEVQKSSGNAEITDGNPCYSLEGAAFDVYSSDYSYVTTITTDANGYGKATDLKAGRYFLKETAAPKGYLVNADWEAAGGSDWVTVPGGGTGHVDCVDAPGNDPDGVLLQKVDAETGEKVAQGSASLALAEYTFEYYEGYYQTANEAKASGEPARTWVMRTNENGFTYLGYGDLSFDYNGKTYPYKVSGDEFYRSTIDNLITIPLGTVVTHESKAPEGYNLSDKTYVSRVVMDGSGNVSVEGDVFPTDSNTGTPQTVAAEQPKRGDLQFSKRDQETMKKMAGVPFLVTSKTTGERHVLVTDANGQFDSSAFASADSRNANDAALTGDEKSGFSVDESKLDAESGVWFGSQANCGSVGAFPYDEYAIEELPCAANEGKQLVHDGFAVWRDSTTVDLGTIDDTTPIVATQAKNADTGEKSLSVAPKQTVLDAVSVSSLVKGDSYRLETSLKDAADGKALTLADGKASVSTEFQAASPSMSVKVEASLSTLNLADHSVVACQKLYDSRGRLLATHEDLADEAQTVKVVPPSIGTTAADGFDSDKNVAAMPGAEVVDSVAYGNVAGGVEHELSAKLVYQDTGEQVVDAAGRPVQASLKFTPAASSGTVQVSMEFDGSNVDADRKCVVQEHLYVSGELIASHDDLSDIAQTVTLTPPRLSTQATDGQGGKNVVATARAKVVDTVKYSGVRKGETYTAAGKLMQPDGTPLLDASGNEVTASKEFTAEAEFGEVSLEFVFDGSGLAQDAEAVAFEKLLYSQTEIAKHEDPGDRDQTVGLLVPWASTTATDGASGGKTVAIDKDATVVDAVEFGNMPGDALVAHSILMDPDTGLPLLVGIPADDETAYPAEGSADLAAPGDNADADETADASAKKDDAAEPSVAQWWASVLDALGAEQVEETIPGELVGYEVYNEADDSWAPLGGPDAATRFDGDAFVAELGGTTFRLSPNEGGSWTYVQSQGGSEVSTSMPASRVRELYSDGEATTKLVCRGEFDAQKAAEAFNAVPEYASAAVVGSADIPAQASGSVEVRMPIDAAGLDGRGAVVFELIARDAGDGMSEALAIHADPDDFGQSVWFTKASIGTELVDATDGDHEALNSKSAKLTDTIRYEGLVKGKQYLAKGWLVDKSTGQPVFANDKKVEATAAFVANDSSGTATVEFEFDASQLAGVDAVAFEELWLDSSLVAEHKDVGDEGQTVKVTETPKGGFYDKTGGSMAWAFALAAAMGAAGLGLMAMAARRARMREAAPVAAEPAASPLDFL